MRRIIQSLLAAAVIAAASPCLAQVTNAPTTNASITIATGNTFQQALAVLGSPPAIRRSLTIENNNTTDSCWVFIGSGAATKALSILLLPGGSYTRYFPYVPSDNIAATCTTTSDTLYVDTQ